MRTLFRLLLVGAVLIFLLLLYRPDVVNNAGSALLSSVGGSTAYGSALLIPNSQGKGNDLQLNLQGLSSTVHYIVSLHEGGCDGKILATVGNVSADTSGNATTTFSLSQLNSALQKGVWVNIHQGTNVNGASVACGQVKVNSTIASQWYQSTPVVTDINASGKNTTTLGANNNISTTNSNTQSLFPSSSFTGFPQTGVAPAQQDTYDNHQFPRKY